MEDNLKKLHLDLLDVINLNLAEMDRTAKYYATLRAANVELRTILRMTAAEIIKASQGNPENN